jgi:hypothetical protein
MERREFLKFAVGLAAGTGAIVAAASAASAAPLMVARPDLDADRPESSASPKPAVAGQDDLARAEVQQVYHRRGHRPWRRRHWRRRRWRRW